MISHIPHNVIFIKALQISLKCCNFRFQLMILKKLNIKIPQKKREKRKKCKKEKKNERKRDKKMLTRKITEIPTFNQKQKRVFQDKRVE